MVQAVPLGETFDHAALRRRGGARGHLSTARLEGIALDAFLVSLGVVALAEIGDKTQLLTLILACKFRKPWPIVAGILVATLANHAFAGAAGLWLQSALGPGVMRWVLGLSFIGMAGWMLVPDRFEEGDAKLARFGVFTTTLITFFLAEMGDKTQVATVALAAKYQAFVPVVAGTTLGMLLADAPAAFLGERLGRRIPTRVVHGLAALIFLALGVATLLGAGRGLGL
jgi:putative Ca2+/H+ antiporter (TMEM165/GDT1 family)